MKDKMNQPIVSVIVPVYNVERYLEQCLNSLIAQTLRDIEIIVLDDGSQDSSLSICNSFAKVDDRIKVFSHPNRGLGETRNRGIQLSKGEYLAFIDSDDYIAENGLELLYKKAKEYSFDVVQGETIMFDDKKRKVRCNLDGIKDFIVTDSTAELFYTNYYFKRIYSHNACDKLYSAKYVKSHNIRFGDNKVVFAEDNWFQLQALFHRCSIGFLNMPYYYYRQQMQSIMHQPKKDLVKRHAKMIDDYKMLCQEKPGLPESKVRSLIAADVMTMAIMNQKISGGNYKAFKKEVGLIKKDTSMNEAICDLFHIRAYKYESNRGKRQYLLALGVLYHLGLNDLAHRLAWIVYMMKK